MRQLLRNLMAGINAARKLAKIRRTMKAPRKTLFKSHPMMQGVVVGPLQKEAKQPSSGIRMCWRVKGRLGTLIAYCPMDGVRDKIKVHDTVTVSSIGGANGRSMGDIPGARYKIIKIGRVPVKEVFLGKKEV